MYVKQLPQSKELDWLSKLAAPYPVNRNQLVTISEEYGFRAIVTKFLKLFPANAWFESRQDFVTRSEDLGYLIGEERASQPEVKIHEED